MTDEVGSDTYDDDALKEYIERYPLIDQKGEEPAYISTYATATSPPVYSDNPSWTPTYDLSAAAADIWQEKASIHIGNFDFAADEGNYKRSQVYQHCTTMARYHLARRSANTIRGQISPKEESFYPNV
jgi:hypothetical protein